MRELQALHCLGVTKQRSGSLGHLDTEAVAVESSSPECSEANNNAVQKISWIPHLRSGTLVCLPLPTDFSPTCVTFQQGLHPRIMGLLGLMMAFVYHLYRASAALKATGETPDKAALAALHVLGRVKDGNCESVCV